jgi:hypothetical protein
MSGVGRVYGSSRIEDMTETLLGCPFLIVRRAGELRGFARGSSGPVAFGSGASTRASSRLPGGPYRLVRVRFMWRVIASMARECSRLPHDLDSPISPAATSRRTSSK